MRFSKRPLRASVVRVIAAFAPVAGCADIREPTMESVVNNPPACASPDSTGCVPSVAQHDAGPHAPTDVTRDATLPDPAPHDTGVPVQDATLTIDAATVDTQCPAKAPVGGGACALPSTTSCSYEPYCGTYATRSARCVQGHWQLGETSCNPPPPAIQCPDAAPPEDAGCSPTAGLNRCNYGSCDGGAAVTYECALSRWQIVERCGAPACPSTRPTHGAPCSLSAGATCGYDPCFDFGPASSAKCVNAAWSVSMTSCNPPPCPSLAPAEGSACNFVPDLMCTFNLSAGGTVVGKCVGGKWQLGVRDAGA